MAGVPLWFIAWMITIFGWLLYETDWMSISLPVGEPLPEPTRKLTDDEVRAILNSIPIRVTEPLCGMDWLLNHEFSLRNWNITVELRYKEQHHTMHIKDPKVIRSVVKAITAKHRRKWLVYPPSHYC